VIHILVGDEAAKNLELAFQEDENLRGEILVLRDTLGIGPLLPSAEEDWKTLRTNFWKTINPSFEEIVNDEEVLKQIIDKAVADEEPACFWMAPCVSDACAYYWLLPYFKAHPGMLHVIQIVGLPFLNEKGQLFYPNNFSYVLPKEFVKTKRLLKEVSPAEFEIDGDEWQRLSEENTWVRIYEGGKKVISKPNTHFDLLLTNCLTDTFAKAHKIVNETMKKITQTLSPQYLEWRLRELISEQKVVVNGDIQKGLKEFEVKTNSTVVDAEIEATQP
jgi:Protein of unknown function/Domain of unknown function (DUF1835)